MKVKEKTTEIVTTAKRVINNAETFIQATALLSLVVFSYSQLDEANLPVWGQWFITAALVIVGLRGVYEYYKFLDK